MQITCSGEALTRTLLRALTRVRRAGLCTAGRHSTGLAAIAWTEAIVVAAFHKSPQSSWVCARHSTLCQGAYIWRSNCMILSIGRPKELRDASYTGLIYEHLPALIPIWKACFMSVLLYENPSNPIRIW